jgi:superoxide dismutase, Fe-Mn family
MTHELPGLPFSFHELEPYIDKETMQIHHDKHHQGYVDKLNNALEKNKELKEKTAEELISNLNEIPEEIRTPVRNNGGGHVNHSFFWKILRVGKEDNAPNPESKIAKAITESFGSLEDFKTKFSEVAATRFGSGWAWLVQNADGKLEVTSTPNQDSPLSEGKKPIIGLDVWEHAYYLKYQNKRPDYIEAFWSILNWEQVEKNFTSN